MQTREKVGIAILIILIIIFAISIWNMQSNAPKVKINCQTACIHIGSMGWTFPGAGPIAKNKFLTKEECIFACQNKIKK
ncbi:MAG: hypothetical protein NTW11_03045 [Candidatus Staskawiczbacteria bacterium]|nr:hypothetical protein [Candidatus Staskawiczbacteria bacterium]